MSVDPSLLEVDLEEDANLNNSGNSGDPILEPGDKPRSKKCGVKQISFVFMLIFPMAIFVIEALLYPLPPQVDAFAPCQINSLMSRDDYRELEGEVAEIREKLTSINQTLLTSNLTYDTLLGYRIAKSMLVEREKELQKSLEQQRGLWRQCITLNLDSVIKTIDPELDTFIQRVICINILAFFLTFLVFALVHNIYQYDHKQSFNISFILQSLIIVMFSFVWSLASIYYCELWNIQVERFLNCL